MTLKASAFGRQGPQPDLLQAAAQRLCADVLIQAAKDCRLGSAEAAYFLHTSTAGFYAQLAGLEDTTRLSELAARCRPKITCEPWQPREGR
jgi:hypothetical protein